MRSIFSYAAVHGAADTQNAAGRFRRSSTKCDQAIIDNVDPFGRDRKQFGDDLNESTRFGGAASLAKGFADCVVYIEGTNCSIVVSAESLTVQDTAKISQVVTSQSGILAQNINIVTVNS